MFRQIIVPTKKNHSVALPPDLYGKQVEVIAFEVEQRKAQISNDKRFLDDIEPIADFPSVDTIRKNAWPEKR